MHNDRPEEEEDALTTVLIHSERMMRSDIEDAVKDLAPREVRFLVDTYYAVQDFRLQAGNEIRALEEAKEPNRFVSWLHASMERIENQTKRVLDVWSAKDPVGAWSRSNIGIGPVLASGLLAHIDIEKAPTVGHIWAFAGLDPTRTWKKGEKRPWNARLKVLCWKLGESFVKFSGREDCFYGALYSQRKMIEKPRNEAGVFAAQAAASLEAKRYGHDTNAFKCYTAGRLPPARVHLRAQRWAVKIFLAHWHEAAHVVRYGKLPPRPYVLEHVPGHAHEILPQHMDQIDGWPALRQQGNAADAVRSHPKRRKPRKG